MVQVDFAAKGELDSKIGILGRVPVSWEGFQHGVLLTEYLESASLFMVACWTQNSFLLASLSNFLPRLLASSLPYISTPLR
jgi:hypothetical protein